MPLLTNLISYWAMDEASGTRNDSHGTNHLTDNNTVASGTGKISNGADFEATNSEYLSHTTNASLDTGDINFSFAAWVNPESISGEPTIVAAWNEGAGSLEHILFANYGGLPTFFVSNGGSFPSVSWGSSLSVGTFQHIAAGHNATANEIWISVNGGTPVTASYSGGVLALGNAFYVGYNQGGAAGRYYDGIIDELGFWKDDIRSDLATLYNGGAGLAYGAFGGGGGSAIAAIQRAYRQRRATQ